MPVQYLQVAAVPLITAKEKDLSFLRSESDLIYQQPLLFAQNPLHPDRVEAFQCFRKQLFHQLNDKPEIQSLCIAYTIANDVFPSSCELLRSRNNIHLLKVHPAFR